MNTSSFCLCQKTISKQIQIDISLYLLQKIPSDQYFIIPVVKDTQICIYFIILVAKDTKNIKIINISLYLLQNIFRNVYFVILVAKVHKYVYCIILVAKDTKNIKIINISLYLSQKMPKYQCRSVVIMGFQVKLEYVILLFRPKNNF